MIALETDISKALKPLKKLPSAKERAAAVQRMARWRKANPERSNAAMRRYRERNSVRLRAERLKWYAENKEKARERLLKYRQTNRAVIAASMRSGGKITQEVREFAAKQKYGCIYCGSVERLHVDHKMPRSRGGRNEVSNLQWLCRTCNHAKHDMTEEEFFVHIKKLVAIRMQFEDCAAMAHK